jgi:hypothetical protein
MGTMGATRLMLTVGALLVALPACAEPYLAVRTGAKCMSCHVNPTGGGKRTEYGNIYAQTTLAAARLDPASGKTTEAPPPHADDIWTGRLNNYVAVGADARANLDASNVPNEEDTLAFDLKSVQLYLDLQPIPNRLSLYVDQRVAPGAAENREAYALLWSASRTAYLKAGRMFLPYGLRLEDDSAFVRQVTGINFASSDDGVEGGLELGSWSAYLAITNGTAGGAETNKGKQWSALLNFVQPDWRVGASFNFNANDAADRQMQNVFAGLRTGIVSWLGEADYIIDDGTAGGRRKLWAGLLEGNVEVARRHNLKLTYEYYDPNLDVDEDQRERYSLVWEYVPFQFTQFRAGYRDNKGIPQNNAQNANQLFLQWHAFF